MISWKTGRIKSFGTPTTPPYLEGEAKARDEEQGEREGGHLIQPLCNTAQRYSEVTKARTTSDKNLVFSPHVTSLKADIFV